METRKKVLHCFYKIFSKMKENAVFLLPLSSGFGHPLRLLLHSAIQMAVMLLLLLLFFFFFLLLLLLQNACGKSSCENGGRCQSGLTQKRYRCLCPPGFNGDLCQEGTDNVVFQGEPSPPLQHNRKHKRKHKSA